MSSIKRKRVLLRPIHPNAGIQQKYRADLNRLLRSVRNDVLATVNQWKDIERQVATDSSPLADAIDQLMITWINRLSELGEQLAKEFVGSTISAYDGNLKRQLRRAGFTVKLQLTDTTIEALKAATGMNVGLIRSIPTQYLADVSKYVYEATSGGFDLATLTDNLDHAYHIGRNRAKLIARDQARKAMGVIEQARRQELGITRAIWYHSGAAKEPRQSHIKANGKEFDVNKGCYIDGEWILPGQKINCGCVSRSVIEV